MPIPVDEPERLLALLDDGGELRQSLLAVAGMDELDERLRGEFFERPAEETRPCRVDTAEEAVRRSDRERVVRDLEEA